MAALAMPVSDGPADLKRLLVMFAGLLVLAQAAIGVAEGARAVALALPVPDGPADPQRLLVLCDGLLVLAQTVARFAEVA